MLGFLIEFTFSSLLLGVVLPIYDNLHPQTTHTHIPASIKLLALWKRRNLHTASPQGYAKTILNANSRKNLTALCATTSSFVIL